MRAMKEVRTQGTVRRRPAPPHAIRASAALAGFATVVLAAAAPSPHARTAAGAPAPEAWRRVRTLEPLGQEAGAIGAAVAVAEGVVWSGTARDADVGDGPTAVQAVVLRAGFGFPTVGAARIAAPAADRSAGFGLAVAAAPAVGVVGAPNAGCRGDGCDTGQAHLVRRAHDGTWHVDEVPCPTPEPASEYGAAVATDGRTLVVASPRADAGAIDAGAVDVFALDPAGGDPRHVLRAASPEPAASGRFGASVAVCGDWIAIGEPGAGREILRPGAVHLLRRNEAGRWEPAQTLRPSAGAIGWYGAAVALAGSELIVGAPIACASSPPFARAGAAEHLRRAGTAWQRVRVIPSPDAAPGDGFGLAVACDGDWVVVGAPGADVAAVPGTPATEAQARDAGCAWAFPSAGGTPQRLVARLPRGGDGFGAGLALGAAAGRAALGPTHMLAIASRNDPERPLTPGSAEVWGMRPAPVLLARHPGVSQPQSMSASAIAIAADASVTTAGAHPSSAARASAAGP
jgi:hypothetical protein